MVFFLKQDNLLQASSLSEYDLGGEGDLFKAPEPILEEPVLLFDPDPAAMSTICSNGNLIIPEASKVTLMESTQNEDLLSEVFCECKKDLLAKSAIIEPSPEASDVKCPAFQPEMDRGVEENKSVMEGPVQKSDSFQCLSSADCINGCIVRPSFLEFQGMNLGAAFGIRRAYSEGDIQVRMNQILLFYIPIFSLFCSFYCSNYCGIVVLPDKLFQNIRSIKECKLYAFLFKSF